MIDTHSHIYSEEFDTDRDEVIQRAKDAGVKHIILPNVDSESLPRMLALEAEYPNYCHAAIGLHPTSVKSDYKFELEKVRSELERRKYIAIGEIGIDLYWDKTFLNEQIKAFQQQIKWALEFDLPVIIHVRDSFNETIKALKPFKGKNLRGVFHSFTGNLAEAHEIMNFGGFKLGINGIVTFKNSGLSEILRNIDLKNIIMETDAPYLTPSPHRGKRNESSFAQYICSHLAEIYETNVNEIAKITTKNALNLFKL
ncbi:MAG: TatD family hydrolase [Paludibacter sp.]|nr:TatD family hydrolase [Paludibacter sp.]